MSGPISYGTNGTILDKLTVNGNSLKGTSTMFPPENAARIGRVVAYWAEITPETAQKILDDVNQKNRKLRSLLSARYKREMNDGRWQITHQGIAFDTDGVLIDGQHRLLAIVESGIAITILVVEGLSPLARKATDQHGKRRPADSFAIVSSYENPELVGRVTSAINTFANGDSKPTYDVLEAVAETVNDGIMWAQSESIDRKKKLNSSPVIGAFVYAFKASPAVVQTLFRELNNGLFSDPHNPMKALYEFALNTRLDSNMIRLELFDKTLSAIHMCLNRESTKQLKAAQYRVDFFKALYR